VGADPNLAPTKTLSLIPGLNPKLAKDIVNDRRKNGPFKNRLELMGRVDMGEKNFAQAAGFLRIAGGDNPLDQTGLRPLHYGLVDKMAADLGLKPADLIADPDLRHKLSIEAYAGQGIDPATVADIIRELERPSGDPRETLDVKTLAKEFDSFGLLKPNDPVRGLVVLIRHYGIFVDIGVHHPAMCHLSKMASTFVRKPSDMVTLGQRVIAWVENVDKGKMNVALTMVNPNHPNSTGRAGRAGQAGQPGSAKTVGHQPIPDDFGPSQDISYEGRDPSALADEPTWSKYVTLRYQQYFDEFKREADEYMEQSQLKYDRGGGRDFGANPYRQGGGQPGDPAPVFYDEEGMIDGNRYPVSPGPDSRYPNPSGFNYRYPDSPGPNLRDPNYRNPNSRGPNSSGPNYRDTNSHGPETHAARTSQAGPSGGPDFSDFQFLALDLQAMGPQSLDYPLPAGPKKGQGLSLLPAPPGPRGPKVPGGQRSPVHRANPGPKNRRGQTPSPENPLYEKYFVDDKNRFWDVRYEFNPFPLDEDWAFGLPNRYRIAPDGNKNSPSRHHDPRKDHRLTGLVELPPVPGTPRAAHEGGPAAANVGRDDPGGWNGKDGPNHRKWRHGAKKYRGRRQ
jgi:predicted RNA-binding protein with RPS1 domain